ncbi:hypothetical protein [Petropleomorpha daqingensis]|uniref:Uncharacterized protein n=1 Tax=Petropleomorpha daqingensis TaxID=2026353 RepID=A0A853CML6_9ACTN|nr:hypothetical protein [Petropleomorpha daqingensis]NYJ07233.1 hypothetical protein [Petropleomorpha daqingensis]
MSGLSVAALVLTAVLVLVGLVLLGRSLRREDATGDLAGLMALIAAGGPASVYGAASG